MDGVTEFWKMKTEMWEEANCEWLVFGIFQGARQGKIGENFHTG